MGDGSGKVGQPTSNRLAAPIVEDATDEDKPAELGPNDVKTQLPCRWGGATVATRAEKLTAEQPCQKLAVRPRPA